MPKKRSKTVEIEVLPPEPVNYAVQVHETLDRLVSQKVQEALEQPGGLTMEPWFRTRQEADAIRRQQRVPERKKWSAYYERWGCIVCETTKKPHAANGFCHSCRTKVYQRLQKVLKDMENPEVARLLGIR